MITLTAALLEARAEPGLYRNNATTELHALLVAQHWEGKTFRGWRVVYMSKPLGQWEINRVKASPGSWDHDQTADLAAATLGLRHRGWTLIQKWSYE